MSTKKHKLALAISQALMALPAMAADEATIPSVIVTAQSRAQSLRDVPISMQVVSAKDIADLGAVNLSDMNGYIPGLSVDGSQPTQPNFALRGIGTGDFGIATDAPVGVYLDGVYLGKTGGSLLDFNDVQRVEVLKGPQGTLFGRNSAAGAIAIVANEPSSERETSATVRVGSHRAVYGEGVLNQPLSDTVAFRLSAVRNRSDGWATNAYNGEKMGGESAWGTRMSLKWAPSSQTKAILSWEHQDIDQTARPAFGVSPQVASGELPPFDPDPAVLAKTFVNPLHSGLRNDAPARETLSLNGVTLRFETPLAGATFASTTSWRKFRSYNRQDNDGTANVATYLDTANAERNTTWQQEFKLSSKNELLDWVAGVSLFRAKVTQVSDVNTTTDTLDTLNYNTGPFAAGGIPAGVPLFPVLYGLALGDGTPFSGGAPASGTQWHEQMINGLTSKSASIYGDVIWHATPSTNVTLGVRFTRDSKTTSWDVPAATSSDPTAAMVANGVLGLNAIVLANASMVAPLFPSASKSWRDTSPRLVIDHKLDASTMLFASLSKGYQSGGFNVFQPSDAGGAFAPEKMTNFEAGFKTYLPALRLSLNGSVFSYRFKNLQGIELLSVSGGGVPTYNITSSNQRGKGVDLDGSIKVSQSVRFFGALEYLDHTYDQKQFTDWAGNSVDLSGQPVGSPKLTMMAGVNVNWPAFGGHADLSLQGNYTSKTRCNAQIIQQWGCLRGGAFETGVATQRADLKLGWMNADRRYGVALLVNNLFNKRYIGTPGGQTSSILGTPYSSISAPRYIGLALSANL
ncbi:iron complex outermembrane receptor protein [Duganella sp. SG902]|uniref:TonB-dependent receptor n=1 Tax=Duganella sp. SG902 TaxID=2587016 RepID=UPI00159E8CCF|nr:TonB-dependent receptor [Duganella sp. SG902]NVM79110.1 iron complex outermembrane receptor protein [Duganella sp. SG902]